MIDEEDDEEILKKGVGFKSLVKNLVLIFIIILGALFIYLGTGETQMTNFFIGFTLICIGASLLQIQRPTPEPFRQTLTILKCKLCDITKVRDYQNGDYVFKELDSCDQCSELMQVKQIYSVKLKKQKPKKKKEKKKT